ncbi:sel1 repeat family protein, partial [Akkermansiaceae bacterium]|nr:sel1 repeat family protein [Akkermansiaceae bacterium]
MKSALSGLLLCFVLASCGEEKSVKAEEAVETEKTIQELAEQGDANAQYNLGGMYFGGEGVPKDYTEAVKWFRKAAEQGNAESQYALFLIYFHGDGVPKDSTEGTKWLRMAA